MNSSNGHDYIASLVKKYPGLTTAELFMHSKQQKQIYHFHIWLLIAQSHKRIYREGSRVCEVTEEKQPMWWPV